MNNEWNELLAQVAQETLESLAYILTMPPEYGDAPEEPGGETDGNTVVMVAFEGPFPGHLLISVTPGILAQLASNMLGLSGEDSAAENVQQDALKELGNVICGNLLPAIAGKKAVFDVKPPQMVAAGASVAGEEFAAHTKLQLDCGQAEIWLCLQGVAQQV